MTDFDVIAAIRRSHLIFDSEHFPGADVQWERATIDLGGTSLWGLGPYLHVPVEVDGDSFVVRVHAPARLRRRLAAQWK